MRLFAAAALAVCLSSAPALAAPRTTALSTPASGPSAAQRDVVPASVRIAMRQESLPPGGRIAEHRQTGERYLYVVSGQLKVSDLVTGEEQMVAAGKMAAEQPGDWHIAEVVGADPVTVYIIDRTPAETAGPSPGN
jgi:quercetin dioxygenase-like cupin family protein